MRRLLAAVLSITILGLAIAQAQTYPSRPVTMVVPFAREGASDIVGRVIAERMQAQLGQPVLVENTFGDGGLEGINRVVRAPSDGYTFLIGTSSLSGSTTIINPWQLDLITRSLEPIGLVGHMPLLILGNRSLPASNLRELLEWVKKSGSRASVGASLATDSYVATILLRQAIDAGFRIVSNRSNAELQKDLAAGEIDMMLSPSIVSHRRVRSGEIKAFAVAASRRIGAAPEIPTTDEAGLPGFHFAPWYGLWAPRHTPDKLVARLNEALVRALDDPLTKARFATIQVELFRRDQQTPEYLKARQKADFDEWWPIVRELLVKLRKT